jgi:hypothetical protein
MFIEKGLVKNARVIIWAMHDHLVEIELLNKRIIMSEAEQFVCLPRINFEFKPKFTNWTVHRRQFPLRLAYATTFNSCQGLTLDRVVLDLRSPVFAHGQLYTSVSRVRTRQDARVLLSEDNSTRETKNIVYRQLLL